MTRDDLIGTLAEFCLDRSNEHLSLAEAYAEVHDLLERLLYDADEPDLFELREGAV